MLSRKYFLLAIFAFPSYVVAQGADQLTPSGDQKKQFFNLSVTEKSADQATLIEEKNSSAESVADEIAGSSAVRKNADSQKKRVLIPRGEVIREKRGPEKNV